MAVFILCRKGEKHIRVGTDSSNIVLRELGLEIFSCIDFGYSKVRCPCQRDPMKVLVSINFVNLFFGYCLMSELAAKFHCRT